MFLYCCFWLILLPYFFVAGFVRALILELWCTLECSSEDVRAVRPKPTPMDPIDRSCLKVLCPSLCLSWFNLKRVWWHFQPTVLVKVSWILRLSKTLLFALAWGPQSLWFTSLDRIFFFFPAVQSRTGSKFDVKLQRVWGARAGDTGLWQEPSRVSQ